LTCVTRSLRKRRHLVGDAHRRLPHAEVMLRPIRGSANTRKPPPERGFQSCWGTWTRTKNNGTRNRRVANYTIPQGRNRSTAPRFKRTGTRPGWRIDNASPGVARHGISAASDLHDSPRLRRPDPVFEVEALFSRGVQVRALQLRGDAMVA